MWESLRELQGIGRKCVNSLERVVRESRRIVDEETARSGPGKEEVHGRRRRRNRRNIVKSPLNTVTPFYVYVL